MEKWDENAGSSIPYGWCSGYGGRGGGIQEEMKRETLSHIEFSPKGERGFVMIRDCFSPLLQS